MITLYYNPACSKSRACLALLQSNPLTSHLPLLLREYLQSPLDRPELEALINKLANPPIELVREIPPEVQEGALAEIGNIINLLFDNPGLLQRPIVEYGQHAIVARPPELALQLFQG